MRVAVFGAGYAGLTAARRLERRLPGDVEIVVVDEHPYHLVQHELHRIVRRPSLEDAITLPLTDVLGRAEVREARVTNVDSEAGEATLSTGPDAEPETLTYDYAAVCLGAETAFYGLPGVEEHAVPLKRLDDAYAIREAALEAGDGHIVVGGGGLSGIQVAGELAALSREEELGLDVTVVEMADRIAPGFDEAFADAVHGELTDRGVTVETGVAVAEADDDAVRMEDGTEHAYDLFVWTGGIGGSDAMGGERPAVRADFRLGDGTFVVGDAGRIVDESGEAVPASAQAAIREASVVAKNIDRLVRHDLDATEGFEPRLEAFGFDAAGWVVSVGDGAVAQVGPVILSGEAAKAAKASIGAGHLGSVGALSRAAELVRSELGWPGADALDSGLLSACAVATTGPVAAARLLNQTDPATPTELGGPLPSLLARSPELLGLDGPVDLTPLTRFADRERIHDATGIDPAAFDVTGLFFGAASGDDGE